MFLPLSLQAPCGGFNVNVGFFAHVPLPDNTLYEVLLCNVELLVHTFFFSHLQSH
jgi:hypothetical protein